MLVNQLSDIFKQVNQDKKEISIQGRYELPAESYVILESIEQILNEVLSIEMSNEMTSRYSDSRSRDIADYLELVQNFQDNEGHVSWLSLEEKSISTISRTFPSQFRNLLSHLSTYNKIIIMSGTLTSDGDFSRLLEQWRLKSKDVITKKLKSPFDYKNQAMVYVPKDLLAPDDPNFINQNIQHINSLINVTGGRTLILATAKDHMDTIEQGISSLSKKLEIKLYKQDQSGVETLTKAFKENETSVLIGSGSYFSGFSVPGNSLISVILNKLPFPVPGDPFLKLIGEGYEDSLFEFIYFPNMINKLNQAAGRLIRDISDIGIFTILNPRVFTSRKFGHKVQIELEKQGYVITRTFDEIVEFVTDKLQEGSQSQYEKYERDKIDVAPLLHESIEKTTEQKSRQGVKQKTIPVSINRNVITEEQAKFARGICEKENIPYPKNIKKPETLYHFLYDKYYTDWKDTEVSHIKEHFPFIDDKQKAKFQKYSGTTRKVVAPNCVNTIGCNGQCNSDRKQKVVDHLIKLGAEQVSFIDCQNQGHCLILTTPGNFIRVNQVNFDGL